jgi:outer membrane protein
MVGRAAKAGHVARRVLRSGICLGVVTCVGFAATTAFSFAATAAWGEALPEAPAKTYQSNPQLNAERARHQVRDAWHGLRTPSGQ